MPDPEDGTAGTIVEPEEAAEAEDADEADPGQVAEVKADQIQAGEGKYGTQKVTPYKKPTADEQEKEEAEQKKQEAKQKKAKQQADEEVSEEAAEEEAQAEVVAVIQEQAIHQKVDWIEIELVGMDDSPIAGMSYEITLPDGKTVDKGTTDSHGKAKLTRIPSGNCQICFPELDGAAWEEA